MSSIKNVFASLSAVALLAFGTPVFACGGNACNPNYGDGRTVTGQIWGVTGFVSQATGQNHTTGSILDRATVSETGGNTNLMGETITNTCDSGDCASRSTMTGDGTAFGRQYEFVSGGGNGSSSRVEGGNALDIGVRSSIFTNQVPGYTQ